MSKPALKAVDNQQPRDTARQPEWHSDAERERLPVVNVVDSGKPLLRVDEVLGHAGHDARIGRK
jgi:hypothetical protein